MVVPQLFVLLGLLAALSSASPVTEPHLPGGDLGKVIPDYFDNKPGRRAYHNSTPDYKVDLHDSTHIDSDATCEIGLKVRWSSDVGGPVYATPVIFPSGPEGRKEVFLSTFYDYVEILGFDGHKPWGWPMAFEDSSFMGSPILFDIDADGTNDIGLVDKDGNLYFMRIGEFGEYLEDFHVQIPRLKVKRNWAKGVSDKYVDTQALLSMFDHSRRHGMDSSKHHTDTDIETELEGAGSAAGRPKPAQADPLRGVKPRHKKGAKQESYPEMKSVAGRRLLGVEEREEQQMRGWDTRRRRLDQQQQQQQGEGDGEGEGEGEGGGSHHDLPDPHQGSEPDQGLASLRGGGSSEQQEQQQPHDPIARAGGHSEQEEEEGDLEDPGIPDFGEGRMEDDFYRTYGDPDVMNALTDDYKAPSAEDPSDGSFAERSQYGYGDLGLDGGASGEDDMYHYYGGYRQENSGHNESDYLHLDAHVMGTPTLADVNNDGHLELIVAVSYYFDKVKYGGKELDFDPSDYVAGGVACWDLQEQTWAWTVHLDLTTDRSHFTAMVHGSPTVADLDGDGRSEVIIGTSLGLLYVLDGETGFVRRYFPMQFHQIEAQVAVADVWGGANLEIIVADMAGNLVLLDVDGDILWDLRLGGTLPFTPTVGDVDGDGQLDIVVTAVTKEHGCLIYAVNGQTGKILPQFPMGLPYKAAASAPVLLVDLHDYTEKDLKKALKETTADDDDVHMPPWAHNSAMGNDKSHRLYTASRTAGSKSDIASEGDNTARVSAAKGLHLVVPSFDGHVYILDPMGSCADRIDVGEHIYSMPLVDDVTGDGELDLVISTFNGQVLVVGTGVPYHPLNAWTSFPKHRTNGFTHGRMGISMPASARGELLHADVRGNKNLSISFDIWDDRNEAALTNRAYKVRITKGTNKIAPIYEGTFDRPGRHTVSVHMLPPESVTLVLGMTNEHGQYYEDAVAVSLNTRFYVWFKYMIMGPLVVLSLPLLLARKRE
jgi:hypothetical protein